MAEADEATNELIARILASDNDQYGYDDLGTGEVSDDSDYGHARKKAKRGKAAKGQAVSKPIVRTERRKSAAEPGEAEDEELTATGRRKRKDTGAKREGAAKGWTAEEEKLFLEGLDLFGREWHKAAAHVGTRDKKAFTSHAQKHFIKLCIADLPLPQKVVETGQGDGMGYTLSGLPLDPNSSSARSYGFKPEHLEKLIASNGPGSKGLLLSGKENQDAKAENIASKALGSENGASAANGVDAPAKDAVVSKAEQIPEKLPPKAIRKKKAEDAPQGPSQPEDPEIPAEPTEYMKNRPRREGAGMRSKWGNTSESLELVSCSEFIGPPGSGASLSQPFEVHVDGQVNLIMDFHAHLSGCEIIGLLGGLWDAEKRQIWVKEAYPCSRIEGSHSSTSVEVDPQAQVKAQEQMEQHGLTSVGWYHSHPVFAPTPSQKDNENQRNQQALHRCSKTGLEPCLGAIVGPYDTTLPTEASVISWFVTQSRGGQLVPFKIRLAGTSLPPQLPNQQLESLFKSLVDTTASAPDRIDMTKEWRPFRLLVDGQPQGGRISNLSKMRLAVSRHLRGEGSDPEAAAAFLDTIFTHLKQAWNVQQSAPAKPSEGNKAEASIAAPVKQQEDRVSATHENSWEATGEQQK